MHIIVAINHTLHVLEKTLPDYAIFDLLRLAFIVFGSIVALFAFRIAYQQKFAVFWAAGVLLSGEVIVELQQIGERFTPWRLPIFWIGAILTWTGVRNVIRKW